MECSLDERLYKLCDVFVHLKALRTSSSAGHHIYDEVGCCSVAGIDYPEASSVDVTMC